jgi:hypothetical protein
MHLCVERTSRGGIAQSDDCFRMPSQLGESNSQVERGNRILRAILENTSKRALGRREPLLLQEFPPGGEGGLDIVRDVMRTTPYRGDERSQTHAQPHSHSPRQMVALSQPSQSERLDSPQTRSPVLERGHQTSREVNTIVILSPSLFILSEAKDLLSRSG